MSEIKYRCGMTTFMWHHIFKKQNLFFLVLVGSYVFLFFFAGEGGGGGVPGLSDTDPKRLAWDALRWTSSLEAELLLLEDGEGLGVLFLFLRFSFFPVILK